MNKQVASDQKRYRTFDDPEAWQVAREFRKAMYRVNRQLPSFEKFELGGQIRWAAVSLRKNIDQGHGCFHYLEPLKFCLNPCGLAGEVAPRLERL